MSFHPLKEIYTKTEKHWSDTWNWMRGNQKVCNNFHLNGIPLSCPCFWDIESMLTPWKKSYDQHIQHIKKQRHYFANRGPSSQGYGFTVVMYGCESWTIKKGECRRIDAFELWCWRILWNPLDCKEIQPVHPKGDQSWVFIGRTDIEAETPILWPPEGRADSFPDTRKD